LKVGRREKERDDYWSETIPAIAAEERVTRIPVTKAEGAKRAISLDRFGAMALMTPILIPTEPKLPKPHSAYEAMVNALCDRGLALAVMAPRASYPTNCEVRRSKRQQSPALTLLSDGKYSPHLQQSLWQSVWLLVGTRVLAHPA
jgi:hypothetical protein